MTQFWRDEQHFLHWTIALVGVVIFSILVQTYLLPYGLALLVGWLVILWWRQSDSGITKSLAFWLLIGSMIFVSGLLGNLFITQNFPISLHESLKWLAGLAVFLSAVRMGPQKTERSLYWLSLLTLFAVFGLLSLLTWIVPALRILPDMNFLYATYGHNHFSALLIFSTPWIVLGNKVWPHSGWKWVLAAWVVWLFSTFSRLGVAVGAGQLLILVWWLKSDKVWRSLLIKWLIVIASLGLLWLGLRSVGKDHVFCTQATYLSERICKTSQEEQRPEYWRQAFESIKQRAVWGSGLGTFSAVSLQHRKAIGSYAAHAHNDYLEWITEAGWWGVCLTMVLWGIWWRYRPRTVDWFERAVWLSTGSLLTLGLFDYDLQFVVFLCVVLVGLGWLVRFQQSAVQKSPAKNFWLKILITSIGVIVMAWATVFLVLNFDWQYGNKRLLAQYGQYYPAHSFLLAKIWPDLSVTQRAELLQLWRSDYRTLEFLLDERGEFFDFESTIQMLQHLYQINPWSRQKYDLAALQLQKNDLPAARQTLAETGAFAVEHLQRFNVSLKSEGDQLRWRQALQYRTLAEKEIEANNGLQAVADLYQVTQFEPWALDDQGMHYCSGLKNWVRQQNNSDPQWQARWSQQLQLFDEIDPFFFGTCKTDLSLLALEQLTVQLQHNRCYGEMCKIWSQRAVRWSENEAWVTQFLARLRVQFPTQEF